MDIKSKFIYFTKPKDTCDIISNAFDQRSRKFAEDNKYGIYYWFNYYFYFRGVPFYILVYCRTVW